VVTIDWRSTGAGDGHPGGKGEACAFCPKSSAAGRR